MSVTIDGYAAEDVYPSNLPREFTPAWIDAVLRRRGVAPARAPRRPFRLLDLGCGDGAGLVMMAAAYPEGRFRGVDAMPAHVAHGQALAARLGLSNVSFHCAVFADVEDAAFPGQDYVTAQGVIAWVSPANRGHVYRIAAGCLRPDGVAVFGYNAMPGWRDIAVFQHMVHALAEAQPGAPEHRFDAAVAQLRALSAAGAAGFPQTLWTWFDGARKTLPAAYFPHEYLNDHWAPQWSDQIAHAMAAHGFRRAGVGNAIRQRDDFAFRSAQRQVLAGITDPVARELAADVLLHASYRVDVFARAGRDGAPQPRLDGWWAATIGEAEATYACDAPAGRLKFDNAAAHAILRGLASGPQPLRAIHGRGDAGTEADVLNAADALFVAGGIVPAEPPAATPLARGVNVAAGQAVRALAGPYGAFGAPSDVIAAALAGDASALTVARRLGASL